MGCNILGWPLFDPFLTHFLRPYESVWTRWDLDFAYGALKGLKKHVKIRPLNMAQILTWPPDGPDLAPDRKDPFLTPFWPFSETCRVSLGTMRPGFCLWSPKRAQKGRKNKTPFLTFLGLPDPQNDHFRSFLTLFQNPTFKSTPGLFHDFAKGGQNLCPQNSQNRCLWRILRVCVQGYHKHIR